MTSVPNRLPLLSGNRWFLFFIIALISAACSPKLQPVAVQPIKKEPEKPAINNQVVKKAEVPPAPKVPTISLLLPFGLEHLAPGSAYTYVSLKKADIAVDYYQGFMLALDSLSSQGYNYRLRVLDTKDEASVAHSLAYKPEVRTSDLIVGPVFPESMKAFSDILVSTGQPIVSPLSAVSPATFKNKNLITVVPPLEYHAWAAAQYINERMKPEKIFILKSGFSEENEYIVPFKKAIDSLSNRQTKTISITVIHGALSSLIPQLSAGETNVFLIASTNQHFLTVTLRALDSLNNSYPVTLFGHPDWRKFSFLNVNILQRLNTHITSADQVNYTATNTVAFSRAYRKAYHAEPSDYAIKGFDEGWYFGQLLAAGELKKGGQTDLADFNGLHNTFHFVKKPGLGWINTHVDLLKYVNFELKKVE
jgi:ABC-type branched-subunit amino acid transport system substrate-binding protein